MDSPEKKPEGQVEEGKSTKTPPVVLPITEEDLALGKKTLRNMDFIYAAGFLGCILIAIFAMTQVPWETRYPVPTRRGHYVPMQMAFVMPLLMIAMFRGRRKPDSHHMRKGSRVAVVIFTLSLCALMIWAQFHMMNEIFDSVAALSRPTATW